MRGAAFESQTGLTRRAAACAVVALVSMVVGGRADAAVHPVNFDPPDFAPGPLTTGPGGISFPQSPVVFAVPGGAAATESAPNALRRAGDCPDVGSSLCSSGDNLLEMNFAHPARRVSFRVGTVVPYTCFEVGCPNVKVVGFDEPSHTVVAETAPTSIESTAIRVELKVPPTGDSPPYAIDKVVYGVGEDPVTGAPIGGDQFTAQIDNLVYDVLEPGDPPPPPPDPLPAPPAISITSPVDGARLDSSAVSLAGRVEAPVGLAAFCISVDDPTSVPASCQRTDLVGSDGGFGISRIAGIHPGTNTITVWARDTRGQQSSASVTVEVTPMESFEVMTYNVQGRPGLTGISDEYDYGMGELTRARQIATYVRGTNVDVVAFNEVFDEDFRRSLDRGLRDDYPFHQAQVDNFAGSRIDDSGLAIYSKFPFIEFDTRRRTGGCIQGSGRSCKVAFRSFGLDCEGFDCGANKGVGYVRLANPNTGRPLNVFFTHMQASRDEGAREERANQLNRHIGRMIPDYTNPATEDTILIGDLNFTDCVLHHCDVFDKREHAFFKRKIAALGLVDLLRTSGLPDDPGLSHGPPGNSRAGGVGGERYDYVLLNSPAPSLCAGRVLVETDEMTGRFKRSHTSLSDHEPFRVELGYSDIGCSAAAADRLPTVPSTTLPAGGTRWFRYEAPGTYVIDADVAGEDEIRIQPLEASGRRARTVSGTQLWTAVSAGPQVVASRGPLYLAVHNNGAATTFAMTVRPAAGTFNSSADLPTAVALDPLTEHSFDLPAGASRAFRLSAQHPDSGKPLTLTANVGNVADKVGVRLLDGSGSEIARGDDFISARIPGRAGQRADYFLVVDSPSTISQTPVVNWRPDVAILDLYKLWCYEQEDNSGDDTIYMKVTIDGGRTRHLALGDFDGEQSRFLPFSADGFFPHQLGFQDDVKIVLRERDPGTDDTLGEIVLKRAPSGNVVTWHRGQHPLTKPLRASRQSTFVFNRDDAYYKLFFWASASG